MVFAVILGIQSVWILLAELSRPGVDQLPIDASAAATAAKQRSAASWAASLGGIRGGLWAEAAFTQANLLWDETNTNAKAVPSALTDLDRALKLAPVDSSAWLLLADFSSRYPSGGVDTIKALKMSYYTGPSEQELLPLRLRVAAHSDFVSDVELREFISRDVRILLTHHQDSAIVTAYNSASSSGKPLIEQLVRETDPSALKLLPQGLPD
jgi:hypothetical protein